MSSNAKKINLYDTQNTDNYYRYQIEDTLIRVKPKGQYNKLIFCIYRINTSGLHPFLEYLLYKYSETNSLSLPISNEQDITKYMNMILTNQYSFRIVGYLNKDDKLLVYIKINQNNNDNNNILKLQSENIWWWTTIDEIVNVKSVYNYKIEESTTELFLKNKKMCFLKDINNKTIQVPSTFYNGNTSSEIVSFQLVFNIIRSSIWNGTGPFYVFNTYETALKFSLTNLKRYIKPVDWQNDNITPTVIRVVLFYDSLKGLLNSKKDKEAPFSDVELIKLKDKTLSKERKNKIKNYRRVKDFEGNWAVNNDAVFVGNIVENNKIVFEGFNITVKDSANIVIISYSDINKNTESIY